MRRLFLLLAVLALGACEATITQGHVTSRQYEDPYIEYITLCNSYNQYAMCTVWQDYPSHVPECWRLLYSGPNEKGEMKDASLCVVRSTWDSYSVGDYIDTKKLEDDYRQV
jgi:hypothetical protein